MLTPSAWATALSGQPFRTSRKDCFCLGLSAAQPRLFMRTAIQVLSSNSTRMRKGRLGEAFASLPFSEALPFV
jgi:hypothetical protein